MGTGLSLALYPPSVRVTGIDICPEMLARAESRRERLQLNNVEALKLMDAEHMEFADDAFDCVVAMYVASVVPDPARLMSEIERVCRPHGDIFVLNHFRSANPFVKRIETLLAPLSTALGFRTDYSLEQFLQQTRLQVAETRRVNLFGHWTLLRICNDKPAQSEVLSTAAIS